MKRHHTSRLHPLLAAGVFLMSLVLYRFTAARYPGWVDATWILHSAGTLELGVWANVHNLFNLLGHLWILLFTGVDPNISLTAFCSFLGALTVLLIYLTGCEITENPIAAALGSMALAVSLSLWWHSTTIEVYTLNTVLIALMFYGLFRAYRCRERGFLYLAFLAGGLGISNHVLMGLFVFAFFIIALPGAVRDFGLSARHVLGLIACYIAGASLFGILFILQWREFYLALSGGTDGTGLHTLLKALIGALQYATGGPFLASMFTRGMSLKTKLFWRANYLFLLFLNYPSAAIVFIVTGFAGLGRLKRYRRIFLFLILGLTTQVIWSANYFIWDMYAFALPVYLMLALPLTAGIANFLKKGIRVPWKILACVSFLIPLGLYPSFAHWPNREHTVDRYMAMYPEVERTGGLWDPADYIFNPIKRHYDDAAVFCEGVLSVLPEGAVYWDDESKGAYPLIYYYQEIAGRRDDVRIQRIFGLIMDEAGATRYARRMLGQLQGGKRVYISSLVEPQREILNQLFFILQPPASPEKIRAMDTEEFSSSFPVYTFNKIPITSDGSLIIYEIGQKNKN